MWWLAVALASPAVLRPEVGTDVPLAVSAGALVEAGPRLRLRGSVGLLPGPYTRAANDMAQALFPSYTDPYRQMVEAGLDHAVVVRVHGGWRPFEKLGAYAHGGWTHLNASGSATGTELLEAIVGRSLPVGTDITTIDARETAHLLDVELGWEQPIARSPLTLRVGLGWSFTMGANASLALQDPVKLPFLASAVDELLADGEVEIERATTAYVHPPVVAVALGWAIPLGRRD